ncbi:DUF6090 family protein [Winogradskyella sp. A3E31]|uniref:DUF6090 family protein n=1 Tax=Winogradskyella sp. A3E31 TaxID=3349637 RepID=UPI00398AA746
MIKFFRKIRYDLMEQNKTGKYFKYTIGEIILVVIGILIALSINNWNEKAKDSVREREILVDLKTSLEDNLDLYSEVFEPRFAIKNKGLEYLKKATYENQNLPNDTLIIYIRAMQRDVIFRYDSGPYDALKSSGFELIRNKELRKRIIKTYEVILPGFSSFINKYNDERVALEQQYENDILKEVIVKEEDGTLEIYGRIKVDNVLEHPSFISLIALEEDKYENYIYRMDFVIETMNLLIGQIENELSP